MIETLINKVQTKNTKTIGGNPHTELGKEFRACRIMVFSRNTLYHYQNPFDHGGIEALIASDVVNLILKAESMSKPRPL